MAKKGVESPRLNAELLLAEVLKIPRMRLYLDFERMLTDPETDNLRTLVVRRSQREPLQHILGRANFCGLDFKVSRDVLVPRAETELLAERAWEFLNKLDGPVRVFDYGTGSGCLAVTIAVKSPQAQILAADISGAALDIARQNAAAHGVADRIRFVMGDALALIQPETHLLVGNPPYIPTHEIEGLEPEVRRYDPSLALDGGPEGLNHYRRIATAAAGSLTTGGKLMLEFGDGQGDPIRRIFQEQNWIVEALTDDYNRQPRIIVAAPRREQAELRGPIN